jgi:methyl-accepting chemotaxis protein
MFVSHPNESLLMKSYKTTWLKNYEPQNDKLLGTAGSFSVNAYSDILNKKVSFTGSSFEIADTGKYWLVAGVVPQKTINESSNFLLVVIIAIGLLIMGTVGIIIYINVNKVTLRLRKAENHLEEVSGIIAEEARQLSSASHIIAEGAGKQAAALEETSATMNETSSMVSLTAENAKFATTLAAKSRENTIRGKEKMVDMVKSMELLKESGDTINKIIKAIEDIASQTNLLAINATIEAARAGGEAGRSFAVVAQEVRNLAAKSAKAAAETSEIIEKNIVLTKSSSTASREVSEILGIIVSEFDKLNEMIKEVSAASEEQSNGIKQINIAVNQIDTTTQSNAAVAEQAEASATELTNSAKNLADVTAEISKMI